MVVAPEAIGTHTVEVSSVKIVKLDKKYLPDLGLAPVATSGSYYDLKDTPAIYSDVVRYGSGQNLTNTQKAQARTNIGTVGYEIQSLTESQKLQARTNIGAGVSNFSGSYNDLTDIIVGETYTYQSITINNIKVSSNTPIPNGIKFEQIPYQTTWKVYWGSSFSNFSLNLNTITRESNYYNYSNSSNRSYSLKVYDNGVIKCSMPNGAYYANITFDSIAVSTVIQLNEKYIPDTIQRVADMPTDHITYTAQALTEGQQKQARTNIGAGTSNFSGDYNNLINKPTGKIVEVFNDESNYALLSMYMPVKYDADYKLVPCEDGDYFYGMVTGSILGGVNKPYFICSLYDAFEPVNMSYNNATELQVGNVYNFVANNHDSFRLATNNDKKYRSMRVTEIVNEYLIRVVDDPINVATDIKDDITLIDQVNGYHYIACMRDGNFVTYCATRSIEITTMPAKIEYTAGEYFDPAGMTVVATAYDGTTREITDFIYPSSYILDGDTFIEIKYIEAGITHMATIPITVTPFDPSVMLVDFEYTANDDGTYTITGWKGTYNGEASTEIIIPNNGLIRV